jgi:hypothetical protein
MLKQFDSRSRPYGEHSDNLKASYTRERFLFVVLYASYYAMLPHVAVSW